MIISTGGSSVSSMQSMLESTTPTHFLSKSPVTSFPSRAVTPSNPLAGSGWINSLSPVEARDLEWSSRIQTLETSLRAEYMSLVQQVKSQCAAEKSAAIAAAVGAAHREKVAAIRQSELLRVEAQKESRSARRAAVMAVSTIREELRKQCGAHTDSWFRGLQETLKSALDQSIKDTYQSMTAALPGSPRDGPIGQHSLRRLQAELLTAQQRAALAEARSISKDSELHELRASFKRHLRMNSAPSLEEALTPSLSPRQSSPPPPTVDWESMRTKLLGMVDERNQQLTELRREMDRKESEMDAVQMAQEDRDSCVARMELEHKKAFQTFREDRRAMISSLSRSHTLALKKQQERCDEEVECLKTQLTALKDQLEEQRVGNGFVMGLTQLQSTSHSLTVELQQQLSTFSDDKEAAVEEAVALLLKQRDSALHRLKTESAKALQEKDALISRLKASLDNVQNGKEDDIAELKVASTKALHELERRIRREESVAREAAVAKAVRRTRLDEMQRAKEAVPPVGEKSASSAELQRLQDELELQQAVFEQRLAQCRQEAEEEKTAAVEQTQQSFQAALDEWQEKVSEWKAETATAWEQDSKRLETALNAAMREKEDVSLQYTSLRDSYETSKEEIASLKGSVEERQAIIRTLEAQLAHTQLERQSVHGANLGMGILSDAELQLVLTSRGVEDCLSWSRSRLEKELHRPVKRESASFEPEDPVFEPQQREFEQQKSPRPTSAWWKAESAEPVVKSPEPVTVPEEEAEEAVVEEDNDSGAGGRKFSNSTWTGGGRNVDSIGLASSLGIRYTVPSAGKKHSKKRKSPQSSSSPLVEQPVVMEKEEEEVAVTPAEDNWIEVLTEDGVPYVYHRITRQTRWERPSRVVAERMEIRMKRELEEQQTRQDERVRELRLAESRRRAEVRAEEEITRSIEDKVARWAKGKGIRELLCGLPRFLRRRGGALARASSSLSVLPVDVSPDEIKRAYKSAIRIVHPDKLASHSLEDRVEAQHIFGTLTNALQAFTQRQKGQPRRGFRGAVSPRGWR